jgi:hypothetical protein
MNHEYRRVGRAEPERLAPARLKPVAAYQGVEKPVSGRQPRRAATGGAQHTGQYVSIHPSRATPDHGPRRRFSTACDAAAMVNA